MSRTYEGIPANLSSLSKAFDHSSTFKKPPRRLYFENNVNHDSSYSSSSSNKDFGVPQNLNFNDEVQNTQLEIKNATSSLRTSSNLPSSEDGQPSSNIHENQWLIPNTKKVTFLVQPDWNNAISSSAFSSGCCPSQNPDSRSQIPIATSESQPLFQNPLKQNYTSKEDIYVPPDISQKTNIPLLRKQSPNLPPSEEDQSSKIHKGSSLLSGQTNQEGQITSPSSTNSYDSDLLRNLDSRSQNPILSQGSQPHFQNLPKQNKDSRKKNRFKNAQNNFQKNNTPSSQKQYSQTWESDIHANDWTKIESNIADSNDSPTSTKISDTNSPHSSTVTITSPSNCPNDGNGETLEPMRLQTRFLTYVKNLVESFSYGSKMLYVCDDEAKRRLKEILKIVFARLELSSGSAENANLDEILNDVKAIQEQFVNHWILKVRDEILNLFPTKKSFGQKYKNFQQNGRSKKYLQKTGADNEETRLLYILNQIALAIIPSSTINLAVPTKWINETNSLYMHYLIFGDRPKDSVLLIDSKKIEQCRTKLQSCLIDYHQRILTPNYQNKKIFEEVPRTLTHDFSKIDKQTHENTLKQHYDAVGQRRLRQPSQLQKRHCFTDNDFETPNKRVQLQSYYIDLLMFQQMTPTSFISNFR